MTDATPQPLAIQVRGLRKSFGKQVVLDGIDLDVAEGTVFALLGPNGAGKTTAIHILSTLISADAGEVLVGGFDVAREPDAVRGVIGLTGQVSAVDGQFTGEENLRLMADLHHLGRERGRQRVAELLERFDLRRRGGEAGDDLLGRHAPAARPRDDARRRAADHLPRRADDRPRSAEPAGDVGHRPRPRRRRRHDLPDDPVPRGGRPARRPDRAARRGSGRRPGHAGRAEAARARRQRPARVRRRGPARPRRRRRSATASRDEQGLALQVPSDGGVHSLRALLDRLDAERDRGRRRCRSGPPTSTTSSCRSPAAATTAQEVADAMTAYALTDSMTMLRRSLRRMRRYPSLTFFIAVIPVVLLLLFVYVFGGTLGRGPRRPAAPARSRRARRYIAYVVPGILLITVAGAATGTAISVAMDMTAGIIARFRTMAIARARCWPGTSSAA